ncbi:hypothetical protein C4F50_05765 [Flavobacterium sp. KB82]|uniref:Uncharacterized protein n=1 Tax=Flavobacterium hungaricum TaxID=2082725 RepID=A0ABR9THD6_9FLAO|nr:hypothetical protein [Flavobacterium hungaricum]
MAKKHSTTAFTRIYKLIAFLILESNLIVSLIIIFISVFEKIRIISSKKISLHNQIKIREFVAKKHSTTAFTRIYKIIAFLILESNLILSSIIKEDNSRFKI